MRQTIECLACTAFYVPALEISVTKGFPLYEGMVCDACNVTLTEHQLVAAVGIWDEDKGIYNIPGWQWRHIRQASPEDIERYEQAETSAKEIRRDPV